MENKSFENMSEKIESIERVKIGSAGVLGSLNFCFGDSKKIEPLFAHQNFKDEKFQFPEALLPVQVTVQVSDIDLSIQDIKFDQSNNLVNHPTTEKLKKFIKNKLLKAQYGNEERPAVVYPKDLSDPIPVETFKLSTVSGDEMLVHRYRGKISEFATWRRAEWLMLFFVDAASRIELEDGNWEIFICKSALPPYSILCAASIYHFPVFGNKSTFTNRQRLAQFLTLPSAWGKGFGEALVTYFHDRALNDPTVDKFTMEDPSEGMLSLRDVVVLKNAKKAGIVTKLQDWLLNSFSQEKFADKFKIPKIAARRALEVLEISKASIGCEDYVSDATFAPLDELRLKVKNRLKRFYDEK